jgi:plasmid rolling circle replication initiator protein Rep
VAAGQKKETDDQEYEDEGKKRKTEEKIRKQNGRFAVSSAVLIRKKNLSPKSDFYGLLFKRLTFQTKPIGFTTTGKNRSFNQPNFYVTVTRRCFARILVRVGLPHLGFSPSNRLTYII